MLLENKVVQKLKLEKKKFFTKNGLLNKEICSDLVFCVNLGLLSQLKGQTLLNESVKRPNIAGFTNSFTPKLIFLNEFEKSPSIFDIENSLCVEMGFTSIFPRNQDATVKLKFELISIKF